MAERYRNLQGQTLLDTGSADFSASERLNTLAESFGQFQRTVTQVGGKWLAGKGQEAGQREGADGAPKIRTGLAAQSFYGEAYNDAATRSYALRVESDLEDTAARLEVEAGNDPDRFRATMDGVRRELLKTAPKETHSIIDQVYQSRVAQGTGRLSQARALEVRAQQRADTSEGIERTIDRLGRMMGSQDPAERAAAEEEQGKLEVIIAAAERDGTFSPLEADTMRIKAARGVTAETVRAKFKAELDNPYGDPLGYLMNLRKANETSEALSPSEEGKLIDTLLGDMREYNAMRASAAQASDDAAKQRYAAGEKLATQLFLDGSLSNRKLYDMVSNDDLDPSVARTLRSALEGNSDRLPKSDPAELFTVETNLLDIDESELAQNSKLTYADRSRLIQKRRDLESGWRGTQQAREAVDRIDRALGLVPGQNVKLLSETELRSRDAALTEYYDAIEALPPAERQMKAIEVADALADKHIRNAKGREAETLKRRKASYIQSAGDPADMSESKRKTYEDKLKQYDANIKAAEEASR